MPVVSPGDYPITVRYLGYEELTVEAAGNDTIYMREQPAALQEVVVESRSHKVLHMLAYVREYSSMSTYTDTVFLFREKMVDFMLPDDPKGGFKGWSMPRIIASKSYYRFTNSEGLDSVSDLCKHHFSWADWIGAGILPAVPSGLRGVETGGDTVRGKYSPSEIWIRNGSRFTFDVDVLASPTARRWVPGLQPFFRKDVEFGQLKVRYNYDNVAQDSIMPADLTGYSFNIESEGRGHSMFMFNKVDESFSVTTYGEVYIIDKEYIKERDARKWERREFGKGEIAILEPAEAPELHASVKMLIDRVNSIDQDQVRLAIAPDRLMMRPEVEKLSFERQALKRLKGMLGIDHMRAKWKWRRNWKERRREMQKRNSERPFEGNSGD